MAGLAAGLPVTDLLTLDAATDSALLWALVRHRLRAGADPAAALADVVRRGRGGRPGLPAQPAAHRRRRDLGHRLGHALSVRATADAALVASEPLDDDPGWPRCPTGTRGGRDRVTTVHADRDAHGDAHVIDR